MLLKTKLYRPHVPPELVSRPHLMRRLDEGLHYKLTMVSAPAGYGKTSLVSAWAAQCQSPIAWLSLDEEDNDPVRFFSYVIAAVQTIQPNLGQEVLNTLQSPQPPPISNLLPTLINQLHDLRERFTIVLDDYHVIASPEIQKALIFIIDHQLPQMHLLIATRTDPPLPIAKLRGRGHLLELRQIDLRFSQEETTTFLKRTSGIELNPKDAGILVNRTEGWVASLQMAALSMRNKQDISGFIARFGGSHEYIVDYFASEILNNLAEQTRSFLLKTSFLDQLCASLCDHVTGQADSQQMLENLQKGNLFLFSLDDDQTWFRYHQLFADFLFKSLVQVDRAGLPDLHLRASQWFEQHDFLHKAVDHAFLAGDFARAARILEDAAEPAMRRGEHLWLLKEIERLTTEQLDAHIRLKLIRAAIFTSTGTLHRAEEALQEIKEQVQTCPGEALIQEYVIGRVVALDAMISVQQGDVIRARQNSLLALEKLPKGTRREASWRADLLLALGLSNSALGNLDEARQNLNMAMKEANLAGDNFTFLEVSAILVDLLWSQGFLIEAVELCQDNLRFIDRLQLGWAPMSGEIMLRWCLLLCERGELTQAEDFLTRGMDLVQRGGVPSVLAWAHHTKIFYLLAKGDLPAAELAIQETDQLQMTGLPERVVSGISALKVLVWVRLSKLEEAERHLKKRDILADSKIRYPYQREFQSLAALLIAKGDLKHADALLERLIDWAAVTKQNRTIICSRVLQSLGFAAHKEKQKAIERLALAMDLAEPEGYFQAILEAGRPVIPLLYEAVQKGVHAGFGTQLLRRFTETLPEPSAADNIQKQSTEIITPLRARELEVLTLAADGLANKDIALKLHITLRTVKFHMTSVMTKLGVENRMQAVAKARMLGIIL